MDFGILMVFWYFGPLQFQNENANILILHSAPRGLLRFGGLVLSTHLDVRHDRDRYASVGKRKLEQSRAS